MGWKIWENEYWTRKAFFSWSIVAWFMCSLWCLRGQLNWVAFTAVAMLTAEAMIMEVKNAEIKNI